MKNFILFLITLVCAGPALAQINCGPTQKYRTMQEIGNGMTVYYNPGVWGRNGEQTHAFDTYGSDGDQICKYLGSTKEVSRTTYYVGSPDYNFLVRLDQSGRWEISGSNKFQTIINSIHCE